MSRRIIRGLAPVLLLGALVAAGPALAGKVPAARLHRIESLIARSHAAEAKGDMDNAVMLMQSAVVLDPARAETYVALGDLYARHKDPHFAHKYYDEALYLNPTMPSALEGAGKADLLIGNPKAAKERLTRLEKSCPHCRETQALGAAVKGADADRADATPASMDKH